MLGWWNEMGSTIEGIGLPGLTSTTNSWEVGRQCPRCKAAIFFWSKRCFWYFTTLLPMLVCCWVLRYHKDAPSWTVSQGLCLAYCSYDVACECLQVFCIGNNSDSKHCVNVGNFWLSTILCQQMKCLSRDMSNIGAPRVVSFPRGLFYLHMLQPQSFMAPLVFWKTICYNHIRDPP